MYCDPQNPTLMCPDTYCANSNFTYTVCQYTTSVDSKRNKTLTNFDACPDISSYSLSCNNFKNCLSVLLYVNQIQAGGGNNTSSVTASGATSVTKIAARCVVGHATDENSIQSNITTAQGAAKTDQSATSLASTLYGPNQHCCMHHY